MLAAFTLCMPCALPAARNACFAASSRLLQARFLLCSEAPQPSIRDLFGLGSLLPGRPGSGGRADGQTGGGDSGGSGNGGAAQRLFGQLAAGGGEEACYAAARSAVQAAMDEAEERVLWGRFKVQ